MKKLDFQKLSSSIIKSVWLGFLLSSFVQFNCNSQTVYSTKSFLEEARKITFQDFFTFPIGPRGVEFSKKMTPLVGKTVLIEGYMVRSDALHKGQFLLTPTPIEINEEDDGPANDLPVHAILVKLDANQSDYVVAQRDGLLRIEGQLQLGRQEEESGQVSWIRIIMSPQSVNILSAGFQESLPPIPGS